MKVFSYLFRSLPGFRSLLAAGVYDGELVRFNPDGSLDPTFTSPWGTCHEGEPWGMRLDSLALQADGKIVVGGESEGGLACLNPVRPRHLDSAVGADQLDPTAGVLRSGHGQPDQAEMSSAGLSSLRQLPALERTAFVSQELSEQDLAHIAECRSLKGLRLSPGQRLNAASLAPLAKLAALEELFLGGAGADAKGLASLSKLCSLRRLVVRNVTPEMLEQISQSSSLRQLEIHGTTFNSDEPQQSLARLHHLESLSIGGYLVTDAALDRLKSLRSLKHLTLHPSIQDTRPGISDVGLAPLKEMPALESLGLYYGGQFTEVGLRHLADVPTLRKLVMPNKEVADAGLNHLQELPRLEHLGAATVLARLPRLGT